MTTNPPLARCGIAAIIAGVLCLVATESLWQTETAPLCFLALLPLVGAILLIVQGWAYVSIAYGDDGKGAGPWWGFARVAAWLTTPPTD